jgi:hypothetical protein
VPPRLTAGSYGPRAQAARCSRGGGAGVADHLLLNQLLRTAGSTDVTVCCVVARSRGPPSIPVELSRFRRRVDAFVSSGTQRRFPAGDGCRTR